MRINLLLAIISGSALMCADALPARAEAFRVGRLVCTSTPRVGLVLGSAQELRCVFVTRRPARQYVYDGRIRRVGLDIGVTSAGTLSWAVFARNSRVGPGTLRGNYVGASGNVAFGPGLGANVLIGGSHRTIALQPLSIERSIGLNLAAGVTNLTLGPRGPG
ncbi:hypothetical protein ABIF65_005489 [Bradyrhizobium japonicum]|uniref:DUF992 domain-containing protein n=1 Tax=Bradyrhizobium TaxID=374 RepID=UPI0004094EC7|nr:MULTISPECIES: DUF992 domain-containing protein [Bradyrhizobium]MBR0882262.1 DUF992 domain-containing protein [Bradyrhizobium liaoningense]MBR0947784.1 DUF992 domain-containing protein [Bradyrhizobium liaoningense]MBR1002162.1 DUF992 domain-containing protein [Bradyrhizobium liaoningense]MBR1068523.1 DUF992 domain-containing protein [Bradyrhizobium liaoningense]MCP1743822.1 hypothetical protein [Bradyrhizobium japonicum]